MKLIKVNIRNGVEYRNEKGYKHRLDGPAVVMNSGLEIWYKNGKKHRVGGPAYIYKEDKEWWVKGKKHRIDGPAVEHSNYYKGYWISGIKYSETDFKNKSRNLKLNKILNGR